MRRRVDRYESIRLHVGASLVLLPHWERSESRHLGKQMTMVPGLRVAHPCIYTSLNHATAGTFWQLNNGRTYSGGRICMDIGNLTVNDEGKKVKYLASSTARAQLSPD